jgi:WD40 repeat protein
MTTSRVLFNLLGHKGRIFDVRSAINPFEAISASEDGNAYIWDLNTKSKVATLFHNNDSEILRACHINTTVACCSCSNGKSILWSKGVDGRYSMIDNGVLDHKDAQIYVCEPIHGINNDSSSIMTAADDVLRIWNVETMRMVSSWSFHQISNDSPSFGGVRNPDNISYIFDAKPCNVQESLVAMALSDGTARLLDMRQNQQGLVCPPSSPHATSVSYITLHYTAIYML